MATTPLLKPGENCWRIEEAERAAILIDGEAYFRAFYEAVQQAQHSIFILSWDIDTLVRLVRDGTGAEGLPTQLGDFLNTIVNRRKGLHAYVLNWDWAMLYAFEREWLPVYKLDWKTHRRLHFHLDDEYPEGASQHQKVVVIDDAVAFVGGFDLTKQRWDTPSHRPDEPLRTTQAGKPYFPFHDVQLLVEGECAAALGQLARQRWYRATGQRLHLRQKKTDSSPWPPSVPSEMHGVKVAIARTENGYRKRRKVREVEQLYLDMIAAARKSIYIENQYFTSWKISEALAKRLQERNGPEVVLVLPLMSGGWLEQYTMDVLRSRLLGQLYEADGERLRIYYPCMSGLDEAHIILHSKVMVIDEILLRVGSSNISNRSMGLDSECDLVIEAEDRHQSSPIAAARNRLLAEHLGVAPETVARRMASKKSLIATIESLRGKERTLTPLEAKVSELAEQLVPEATIIDPERPLSAEQLADHLLPEEERKTTGRRLMLTATILAGVLALTAAWRWTPLSDWLSRETLLFAANWVKESPLTPLVVFAIYLFGGLVAFPITLLIVVTVITFGPWMGFVYALVGAELSALLGYAVGELLGRDVVRRFAGAHINRLSRRLAQHGILAVITIRVIPIAPFTVTNLVAGASHISFRDFALGNLFGLAPGIIAIALFTDTLMATVSEPNLPGFILLAVMVAVIAVIAIAMQRWLVRKRKGGLKRPSRSVEQQDD